MKTSNDSVVKFTPPWVWAFILATMVVLLSSVGALAGQGDSKAPPKTTKATAVKPAPAKTTKPSVAKTPPPSNSKAKKVVITGSNIPREVKSYGNVRETTSPVYVVDRKQIEQSGAMTTQELLRKLPFVR